MKFRKLTYDIEHFLKEIQLYFDFGIFFQINNFGTDNKI